MRSNETMAWLSSGPSTSSSTTSSKNKHVPQDVFDQDFQHGNPNVLLAGGRQPRLWLTDLRVPEVQWSSVPHVSSIAHLKSVNEFQILVAGLRSSMCLYDMRFFGRRNPNYTSAGGGQEGQRRGGPGNGMTPILRFDGYQNEAHFHTGWDVCVELGLVAAAHDDGTVKLFSLKSGRRLGAGMGQEQPQQQRQRQAGQRGRRQPLQEQGGYALDAIRSETPIRALMFQQMPREKMPSLFVGEGPLLRKFSVGLGEVGEEG